MHTQQAPTPLRPRPYRRTLCLLAAVAAPLLTIGSPASAAPYATWHNGTVANSTIPGVADGEYYTITLLFDNGGNTVLNQSWSVGQLTCVIWRFGNGIVYAQDLTGHTLTGSGTATTDGTGYLTAIFSDLRDGPIAPGGYSATPHIGGAVDWRADGQNPAFRHRAGQPGEAGFDAANADVTQANRWWPPQLASAAGYSTCAAPAPPPPPPAPTPVPALGQAALALLGAGVGVLGLWRRRRGV